MRLGVDGVLGAADERAVFEKVVALGDLDGKLGERGLCGRRKTCTSWAIAENRPLFFTNLIECKTEDE